MLKERIKRARGRLKLTQRALGDKLGVTREAVSQWESGDSAPSSERLRNLAVICQVNYDWLATGRGDEDAGQVVPGLPLRGTVSAGIWTEVVENQDMQVRRVPVAPDSRYPQHAQYALRVEGTSVDRVAPHGTILMVVDFWEASLEVRNGDLVVVERRRGGLVETTVKRVKFNKKVIELHPESDDPTHPAPIRLKVGKEDAEVAIKGLVIGVFSPIARGA